MAEVRAGKRKHVDHASRDDAQRLRAHLEERQPLRKKSAFRKRFSYGAVVLARIEKTGAVARRVKEIGDDDVVTRFAGAYEAARIGYVDGDVGRRVEVMPVAKFRQELHDLRQ